ncbi:MAG: DUF2805 domain-containing protein [Stygiobacter sp.]
MSGEMKLSSFKMWRKRASGSKMRQSGSV